MQPFHSRPIPFFVIPALLVALLAGSGCGQRETQVEAATRDQLMLVGNGAEPADLDPQTTTGSPDVNIVRTLFEGLTRLEPTTLEPLPGQAESWDISNDGLRYTFHLRPDLQWSDGTPLTAADFVASFRRILTPALGSDNAHDLLVVVNAEAYNKGELKDFSQVGFRAPDERTLEVSLWRPVPYLLKNMGARAWFPVPLHVIEKFGEPVAPGNPWTHAGNLVGNGPFVLTAWEPNRLAEVRRNPHYWNRESVRLNGVRFIPMEDTAAEEASFRSGQLHKTERVPLNKISTYRREAPEKLHIHPLSGVYYYSFNVNRAPFNDARVRRALALAVDRTSIVQNLTRAEETPAWHFTPEGIDGYVSRSRIRLDFAEARRLLAEAGYPNGQGLPPITLLYNTAENHRVIAEFLQASWKRELGVEIKLENQEWKVFLDNTQRQDYQLCRMGLIMEPYDPAEFLRVFTKDFGFNRTGWSDPEYDRLYEEIVRTVDHAKRLELLQRMEAILTEAMPILPVYYYTNQYLMDPVVRGWADNAMSFEPFERAWLE